MAEKKEVDYKPFTAEDSVAAYNDKTAEEAAELAAEAGVAEAAHVDLDAALKNFESRSDVETLADRRAREAGTDYGAAVDAVSVGRGSGGTVTSDKVTGKTGRKTAERVKAEENKDK